MIVIEFQRCVAHGLIRQRTGRGLVVVLCGVGRSTTAAASVEPVVCATREASKQLRTPLSHASLMHSSTQHHCTAQDASPCTHACSCGDARTEGQRMPREGKGAAGSNNSTKIRWEKRANQTRAVTTHNEAASHSLCAWAGRRNDAAHPPGLLPTSCECVCLDD